MTKPIHGALPGVAPNLGDLTHTPGANPAGAASTTELGSTGPKGAQSAARAGNAEYIFPNAPAPARFWDRDQDGLPQGGEKVLAGLGNGDPIPDFKWTAAPKLVFLEPCRGLANTANAELGWWGLLEDVAQRHVLQTQIDGMTKLVDNLGQPNNLGALTGVERASVKRSDFVPDANTFGFAGAPSGGVLKRVDVEFSGQLGSLAASFWTETKAGAVVNGGWIGKVPEDLAWVGLAQTAPSYFGARFDVKD